MAMLRTCFCLILMMAASGCVAEQHLRQAHAARVANRHSEAVDHMELALNAMPSLAQNDDFVAKLQSARARAAYQRGMDQQSRNEYDKATRSYRAALKADPTFKPPGEALKQLGPEAANWLLQESAPLIDAGKLDRAIELLQRAVQYDPTNTAAAARLNSTIELRRARREQADQLLNQSAAAAQRYEWDESIRLAREASNLIPDDQPIRNRIAQLHTGATSYWLDQGRLSLKDNKWTEADDAFNRAITYSADDTRAHQALADVDIARGRDAQQRGLLGTAMRNYQAAEAHKQGAAIHNVNAMRRAILESYAIPIRIQSTDAALVASVRDQINRRADSLFKHADEGSEIDLMVSDFDTQTTLLNSRNATHSYTVDVTVTNPRVPQLQAQLDSARHHLLDVRRQYALSCTYCHGLGYGYHHKTRRRFRCHHCHGCGRVYFRITSFDVSRAARKVRQLEHELRHEPATIQQPQPASRNYTVHKWQKTGTLAVMLDITGYAQTTIRKQLSQTDTTIDGANPGIGLRPNPLKLLSDSELRTRLNYQVSQQAARHVIQTLLPQRLADLDTKLKNASGDEARELRIATDLIREHAK